MPISEKAVAIGLTGPFGSGCSLAAEFIETRLKYTKCKLSQEIRSIWKKNNPRKDPDRKSLQELGNKIRIEAKNPGQIAKLAIEILKGKDKKLDKIVFDGIKNVGEIEILKERFGRNFYLIALECPTSERFERLIHIYEGKEKNEFEIFTEDNERDRDQEDPFGQQVELCVDSADALIINDDTITHTVLRKKIIEFVKLITGETPRYAKPSEILMNLAYSASHGSKCLKRQVGAILVNAEPGKMGEIVGQGFNENPISTLPCIEEPNYGANPKKDILGKCYRDMVRLETYKTLAIQKIKCPKCGNNIKEPKTSQPPWLCHNCKVNFEKFFWPERAMTYCTAVHAEIMAVLAAGSKAKGTTLYTTTLPCFQCSEKIIQAGIKFIVFTEPYGDVRVAERLQIGGIETQRFEGIRSGRFDEIFSRARPYTTKL